MKKRLALEAFLTFVTEGIIPDLKHLISNILTLKSKTVTLFFGIFFPFFLCHIMGYVNSYGKLWMTEKKHLEDYKILMKRKQYYIIFLLFFIPLLIGYTVQIIDASSKEYLKVVSIIIYLAMDIVLNILLTTMYYTVFYLLKAKKSS
jgi:hypothetical protein